MCASMSYAVLFHVNVDMLLALIHNLVKIDY